MNEEKYTYYYGPKKNMEPKKEETTIINETPTNGYDVANSAISATGTIVVILGMCYGIYKGTSAFIKLINDSNNNNSNNNGDDAE